MSASAKGSVSAEDWSKAEALAVQYLKTEKRVSEPLSFRRFEATPFLFGAWWTGGDTHVLVHGDKVHAERGVAALPRYFEFLGAARLRALDVELLDGMLQALGASRPTPPDVGRPWRWVEQYKDLLPTLRDKDGVLEYVVHYVQLESPLPPELRGPPAPPPPPGGARLLGGPMVLQRWSLQLFPVLPNLDWKLEARVERPDPAVKTP